MEIKSGSIVCSDPGYESGCWCAMSLPAVDGTYKVYCTSEDFGKFGIRNTVLEIVHSEYEDSIGVNEWLQENFAGVDSGTFGFFDRQYYDEYHTGTTDDAWYEEHLMENIDQKWEITDRLGVWAEAGYGDGAYPVEFYVKPYTSLAVAVKVTFID